MNFDFTSEDLITAANPASGEWMIGVPATGTYAGELCKKLFDGSIVPFPGGVSLPNTQIFIATAGQTVFTPGGFTPTTSTKVTQGGARVSIGTVYDITTNPGSVTFAIGQPDGMEIIIDEF